MHIRIMTERDLSSALRLKEIAGWNQTAADWKRFLNASPEGCFVADVDSQVRGTVTTISFERRFAWVGMVLVDPQFRSRGIGTCLLRKAIEYLDEIKVPSIKLDATPQGKPLYEKLGFVVEYEIERWTLHRSHQQPSKTPSNFSAAELPAAILEADRQIFGADRSQLLQSLHQETPAFTSQIWRNEHLQGYALGRRGSFADQLGPWITNQKEAARTLLKEFLSCSTRETLIVDCRKANGMAGRLLKSFGFTIARPLTRMYRGANDYPGDAESVCAIMGPEFG